MIKIVALGSLIYTIITSVGAAYYVGWPFSLSVLLGGATVLISIAGLSFSWRLIFMKKSIALVVLVIIFKYLLLGMVLLSLVKFKWLSPTGFCIGLGALVFGVLAATIFNSLVRKLY